MYILNKHNICIKQMNPHIDMQRTTYMIVGLQNFSREVFETFPKLAEPTAHWRVRLWVLSY